MLRISALSSMPINTKLGKYLGIPYIMGQMNTKTFEYLQERIEGCLEGWKAKKLTLAGRITLAKTVLTSTPLYFMQSNKLLKTLCNNIDKTVRNFIWGSSKEERKLYLINWETMTKGKDMGGLGIRSMQNMNLTFMAKLG